LRISPAARSFGRPVVLPPALDALGQIPFPLPVEQWNAAHVPQVQPQVAVGGHAVGREGPACSARTSAEPPEQAQKGATD
jgi:hypothetical protein